MIRIYKDTDVKVVTNGAFEQFYKPLGYNIVLDTVQEEPVETVVDTPVVETKETVSKPKRSSSNSKKNRNRATEY